MNTTQFPGIAKAVGAQRGGKYLKRIPKPGGGYRYVYKEGEKPKLKKVKPEGFTPAKVADVDKLSGNKARDVVESAFFKLPMSKVKEIAKDQEIEGEIPWVKPMAAKVDVYEMVFKRGLQSDQFKSYVKMAHNYGIVKIAGVAEKVKVYE